MLLRITNCCWFAAAVILLSGCSHPVVEKVSPERGFWSEKPATTWEQALVTGNGTIGALVMAQPLSDTLILSHARLYMPLHEPLKPVGTGAALDTIRRMMFAGRYGEASQFVVDVSHREGWGGKRWTDPFVPAFDLRIRMEGDTLVQDYRRMVDFTTGEASVVWTGSSGTLSRDVFASRADTLLVIRVRGTAPGSVNCMVSLADRPKDHSWWQGLYDGTVRSSEVREEGKWLEYRGSFDKDWPGSTKGLAGAVFLLNSGGRIVETGEGLRVEGASELLMLARLEPAFDREELESGRLAQRIRLKILQARPDYRRLLDRHRKIHGELFNRVTLDLGGATERQLSSEQLLAKSESRPLPALIEKEFDASRYNILCATGIMPPNLQGIWAGTTAPPWSGDFTQNGNVQVAIASLLPGNMPELMEGFFRYQESLLPQYRENAGMLYGARGIHVASRTSTHGLNNHFDRTWPMTFWTAGAAWVSQFYYDYYLYTGDLEFLKQRAYPFMQEAALFYRDFLISGADGKWVFNPSYSPENNPGNSPDQACINATMDVMAARQLFRNLIGAGELLGVSPDTLSAWKAFLQKMPEYQINQDGALREYMWNQLSDNYAHRHASHLYGLWDVTDPDILRDPILMDACRRAVDQRMKVRRQENGGVMAFGMVQLALAAAAVGDATAVQDMVNWLGSVYWFPNLVTTHNPHELFNLDLSGGFPAVIIKSLVYSEPGRVDLFPARPPDWKSGEIRGVLLRGRITVESLKWEPGGVLVILRSPADQTIRLSCKGFGEPREAVLKAGQATQIAFGTIATD